MPLQFTCAQAHSARELGPLWWVLKAMRAESDSKCSQGYQNYYGDLGPEVCLKTTLQAMIKYISKMMLNEVIFGVSCILIALSFQDDLSIEVIKFPT